MARNLPNGYLIQKHHHRRSQLIYGTTGSIVVSTAQGHWVVPPQRAVWIPAGTTHEMRTAGAVKMRTVYVEPDARPDLPSKCQVMLVRPLLRELIKVAARFPIDCEKSCRDERVIELILDELLPLDVQPLHLPWPNDSRAKRACELMTEDLSETVDMRQIGVLAGASKRTLERLFPQETGLSCAQWRRQAKLLHALELLANNNSVSFVAEAVGYESVSAFSSLFRLQFGATPSKYFGIAPWDPR